MLGGEGFTLRPSISRILWDIGVEGFTVPGRPLAGGCAQTRESMMVPWLLFLVLSRSVLHCRLILCRLASIWVGPGVQSLQGENYAYSRVLGHVQL